MKYDDGNGRDAILFCPWREENGDCAFFRPHSIKGYIKCTKSAQKDCVKHRAGIFPIKESQSRKKGVEDENRYQIYQGNQSDYAKCNPKRVF